jgi:hypothetical protein
VATTAIANRRRRHWRSRSVISHTVGRSYCRVVPNATVNHRVHARHHRMASTAQRLINR